MSSECIENVKVLSVLGAAALFASTAACGSTGSFGRSAGVYVNGLSQGCKIFVTGPREAGRCDYNREVGSNLAEANNSPVRRNGVSLLSNGACCLDSIVSFCDAAER
jgi:hypothetical protein